MQSVTLICSRIALLVGTCLIPTLAHAYLGPGLGAGTIAVVLGVLASVFLAIFGVLWYPFKRWRKRRKAASEKPDDS